MPQPRAVYNGDLKYSLWPCAIHNGHSVKLKAQCHWCSKEIAYAYATVDHDPPRAFGGDDSRIVLACKNCNNERSREDSKLALLYRVILSLSTENYIIFLSTDFDLERFYNTFKGSE